MRIISGKYKSKQIVAPSNLPVRPTTDFAKEALFNILRTRYSIETSNVLDLFSGTGNLTYEFISRDCKSIISVDNNAECVKFIKLTIPSLKYNSFSVVKSDVFEYLNQVNRQFDIIVADPPFELPEIHKIPELIFKNNLLSKNGVLVVEHGTKTDLKEQANFIEKRKYGSVCFSIFSAEE